MENANSELKNAQGFLPPLAVLPNSREFLLLDRFLACPVLTERKGETLSVSQGTAVDGSTRLIIKSESKRSFSILTIENVKFFQAERRTLNSNVIKIWTFLLQTLARQSSVGNVPERIEVSLVEMVSLGIASSVESAKKAVKHLLHSLSSADEGNRTPMTLSITRT